jgi:very-short-patch-repair endonuclease
LNDGRGGAFLSREVGMANDFARMLRKRMTPAEVRLWSRLRALRELGFHFRRQVPIAGFVVDFACFDQKLAVEVDGDTHGGPSQQRRDAARDAELSARGFRVVRVPNNEVLGNIDGVMEYLALHLGDPGPRRRSSRSPPGQPE